MKNIIFIISLLFAVMLIGCEKNIKEIVSETDIAEESTESLIIENSLKISEHSETEMIYIKVLDKLFCNTGNDVTEEVIESIETSDIDTPYIGTVSSVVDSGIEPTKDMLANFGNVGAEVVFYSDGIAVNMDGRWIEFEAYSTNIE